MSFSSNFRLPTGTLSSNQPYLVPATQLSMAVRHDEYYLDDGDVIFRVENKIFKVHKRVVTRSETSTFRTMLNLPRSPQTAGQTDEWPIVLEGDTSLEDFECLMRILYPPTLDDIWKIPIRTYCGAMRVAIKYSMEDIKIAITRVIEKLPSPETSQAIRLLALMAEFPAHFSISLAGVMLYQVCSPSSTPSADDLKPLMVYPALATAIIINRDSMLKTYLRPDFYKPPVPAPGTKEWSQKELKSFGFSE